MVSIIEKKTDYHRSTKIGENRHIFYFAHFQISDINVDYTFALLLFIDENEVLNDLPDLKTALRTRSNGSSMLETTLIICGASYDPDNAKIQDGKNKNNQIEKKTSYNTSVDDAAFESLYRHSWRHKGNEKVIDKFLITNNSTNVKRMSGHSMDMCLEGIFKRYC